MLVAIVRQLMTFGLPHPPFLSSLFIYLSLSIFFFLFLSLSFSLSSLLFPSLLYYFLSLSLSLSLYLSISISLSLSHTHTHHTRTTNKHTSRNVSTVYSCIFRGTAKSKFLLYWYKRETQEIWRGIPEIIKSTGVMATEKEW